jgi:hypothetical protein
MKKLILLFIVLGFIGCEQSKEDGIKEIEKIVTSKFMKICYEEKELIIRGCDNNGCRNNAIIFWNIDNNGKPIKCKGDKK